MSGLNKRERSYAAQVCDEQQVKMYENAGLQYPGRMCEVTRARAFGDDEYLKEKWTEGNCSPQLVVDHIDNNDDNNPTDGSNWQWLCRCHNVKKDPPVDHFRHKKFEKHDRKHDVTRLDNGMPDVKNDQFEHAKLRNDNGVKQLLETGRRGEGYTQRRGLGEGGKLMDLRGGRRENQWYGEEDLRVNSYEMAKNIGLHRIFETIIKKLMRRLREANWSDLVDAAVQDTRSELPNGTILRITIDTGNKWLRPMTSKFSSTSLFYVDRIGGEKIVRWKKEQKKMAKKPKQAGGSKAEAMQ